MNHRWILKHTGTIHAAYFNSSSRFFVPRVEGATFYTTKDEAASSYMKSFCKPKLITFDDAKCHWREATAEEEGAHEFIFEHKRKLGANAVVVSDVGDSNQEEW